MRICAIPTRTTTGSPAQLTRRPSPRRRTAAGPPPPPATRLTSERPPLSPRSPPRLNSSRLHRIGSSWGSRAAPAPPPIRRCPSACRRPAHLPRVRHAALPRNLPAGRRHLRQRVQGHQPADGGGGGHQAHEAQVLQLGRVPGAARGAGGWSHACAAARCGTAWPLSERAGHAAGRL